MISMFCHEEKPGITCAKNLRKGTKLEIREILSPHLLQRGPSELKISFVEVITAVSGESCPGAPRTRPRGASASGPPPGGSRARDARWALSILLIFVDPDQNLDFSRCVDPDPCRQKDTLRNFSFWRAALFDQNFSQWKLFCDQNRGPNSYSARGPDLPKSLGQVQLMCSRSTVFI
jgi:hypothetical protein